MWADTGEGPEDLRRKVVDLQYELDSCKVNWKSDAEKLRKLEEPPWAIVYIVLPIFLGVAPLVDLAARASLHKVPDYDVGVAFTGAGLMVALLGSLQRFWKFRDEEGLTFWALLIYAGVTLAGIVGMFLSGVLAT